MAFEIVAFDFPDAFAAAPKVYAKKVHHCSGSTSIRVYLFLFIGSKSKKPDTDASRHRSKSL
jgi:hypothetical protein